MGFKKQQTSLEHNSLVDVPLSSLNPTLALWTDDPMVVSMAGNKAKFTGNHGFYVLILFSRCPEKCPSNSRIRSYKPRKKMQKPSGNHIWYKASFTAGKIMELNGGFSSKSGLITGG